MDSCLIPCAGMLAGVVSHMFADARPCQRLLVCSLLQTTGLWRSQTLPAWCGRSSQRRRTSASQVSKVFMRSLNCPLRREWSRAVTAC